MVANFTYLMNRKNYIKLQYSKPFENMQTNDLYKIELLEWDILEKLVKS